MGIQILHPTEGMIMGITPSTWQKKGPLAGFWLQVVACSLMDFLTPYCFAQMWTDENLIWHRLFRTMSDSCMLSQPLFHHILLTTLLASELGPLDAAFLVIS